MAELGRLRYQILTNKVVDILGQQGFLAYVNVCH